MLHSIQACWVLPAPQQMTRESSTVLNHWLSMKLLFDSQIQTFFFLTWKILAWNFLELCHSFFQFPINSFSWDSFPNAFWIPCTSWQLFLFISVLRTTDSFIFIVFLQTSVTLCYILPTASQLHQVTWRCSICQLPPSRWIVDCCFCCVCVFFFFFIWDT